MMVILFGFLLCSISAASATTLSEGEIPGKNQSDSEISKSELTKREEPVAQRRDHSFNPDGTVNYHGSGSGHDSGDLVPPPGGGIFNSPSIEVISSSGPSGLSNSYGAPIPTNAYGPPKNIFDGIKPSGSYGAPSQQYGPPSNKYLPSPKPVYGPPKSQHRPPPPKPIYGPPTVSHFGPPKSTYGPPKGTRPKPSLSSRPKPVYGPPKQSFGGGGGGGGGFPHGTLLSPVSNIKSQYGPPKISASYGTPLQPSTSYGAPKHPKGGHINIPPTPPVVKYDGWKPIPGLVSNPPSGSYGAPESSGHGFDFSSTGQISASGFDGIVPPSSSSFGVSGPPSSSYGAPSFGGSPFVFSKFGTQLQPSSSYGPPPKPSPSYGTPLQPSTSYGLPNGNKGSSKLNFLSAGKGPNFSFGLPEPSLGPTPPKPSSSYGPPKPSLSYGSPKAPSISYGPPKPPSISYGPPKSPSSSYGPPKPPSSSYGPPKFTSVSYGLPKPPSTSYGPPSIPASSYGPPSSISSSFTPPKPATSSFIPPKIPSFSYGPPKAPSSSYGPPKAPSNSYGPPKPPSSSYGPPQVFTTYSIPKPSVSIGTTLNTAYRGSSIPHPLQPPSTYGVPSFSGGGLYKTPLPPNALYGVPTAPAPPLFDAGFHGANANFGASLTDLHSPVAPVPSIDISSQFVSTGSGPLFPSTSYGTPIIASTQSTYQPPANTYGVPTALPLRQPKNPVKFRPPVPPGLISSIGAKWGDSAAWGGNVNSYKFSGNTYIPPAVPDPDPGIQANKGNPLIIPPPPAPPINYGPPSSDGHNEDHHQVSNAFGSASIHSSGGGDLNPPPAPHGHGSYDIQQSASVELSNSNNLDQQVHLSDNQNYFPEGGVTNYNAPINSGHHQPAEGPSGQDFSSDVHIKGNQGSYTLQIQAAGGNSGEHVPHNEVLSNGLLQDILTAIENPSASGKLEQYTASQSNDPVASDIGLNILRQLGGTDAQQSNSIQLPSQYGSDLSHASSNNIPIVGKNSGLSSEILSESQTNVTEDTAQALGPVRTSRLDSSTVRVTPYPQPTVYSQPQVAVPDSTVQESELATASECQVQSTKPAVEQPASGIATDNTFLQGKPGTTNASVGHSCVQNSATGPYGTTATIPVIQPSCVLPVEQLIGNGVLTNFSNGNCVPGSSCFATVLPANVLGVNSNACVPVTPRFQTSVVDSSVALTDCRCQAEGSGCCHPAIASYPSAQGPTSMIFVPYSLPNYPPQQRGNPAPKTSPCSGTTPIKETKGSRATSPRSHPKPDTSQHYHIFVGDLSPEIDTQTLRDAFAPFGEISDSRVVRDAQTLKSKGYGFVSFIKKSEAKSAIAAMNGRWLGSRSIRTNWATRKPPLIKADGNPLPLSFDEVYKQSSASNCTVYCGGIINGLTEELVQKIFSPFGNIQEIKVFKDKGYAFVRFSTKESAAHAIVAVHNTEVNGQMVKCSWGKESSELANIQPGAQFDQPVANANFPYAYSQQMGYWYPQSFPATTTQIPGQYLQSGFSLGQFGYHQDFIGRLSMSSIWNGMPGQSQLPTTVQTIGQGTAIQQPNSVVAAYPVQRFQLSEEEWTTPSLLV